MRSMKMEEEREESETTDLWTADEECQKDKPSHTLIHPTTSSGLVP